MRLADLRPNFSTMDKTARLTAVSEYRAKRLHALTHLDPFIKATKTKVKKETDSSQTITAAEKALLKKLGLSLKGIKNLGD